MDPLLRWLKAQSMEDYIIAKRADNILSQESMSSGRPSRSQFRQLGRKTVVSPRFAQLQMPQRRPNISRMTPGPAPPIIIDLSDSEPESDDDDGRRSISSKRARESEMEPARFIDLRRLQARKQADRRSRESGSRFLHRKQSADVEELEKRMGRKPQKKTQVAYKSAPKPVETRPPVQSKTALLFKLIIPTSAARKVAQAMAPSSSEEEDDASEENADDSDIEEEENIANDSNAFHNGAPEFMYIDKDEASPMSTVEPEPLIQLFRTFQLHTDSTRIFQETKQLPFLLRNLRKSFKTLCRDLDIPCTPLRHDNAENILIRYEHLEGASFERTLPKWFCPLCDLFGKLDTREMLKIHLELAHKNIFFDWIQPAENERHDGASWRLHVLFPEADKYAASGASTPEMSTPEPSTLQKDPYALFPPEEPVTPLLPFPKTPRPREYPRPPPSSNRLGAAARPPYLPAKSTFGGPDIYYSTRIRGPYLFDLLQLLPLKQFGLLEWIVLDREEEIFADDEVRDEQKVIVALWARWIMLNKNTFWKDRVNGVMMFIDEYWRMIHLAAGWQALVDQLVVLGAHRLIKSREIVPLIKHYEDLVGMNYWDEWDSEEE